MSEQPWQFDPAKHKSTADVYYVRDQHGSWGYFFVHQSGIFQAFTDYGNYAYGWPDTAREESLKSFLSRLRGTDYLLSKISNQDVLDGERTRKAFVESLLRDRRDGRISKDRVRELYDGIKKVFDDELVSWGQEQPELGYDCYEMARHDYPARARCFVERLWPLFVQILKDEMAAKPAGDAA